ncbi:Hint domain-containing protein [Acetobacter sp. AAB5]|uniref:Hint domain-containing protein n=1 Tax=Acetobacter sp. AAB5 TaxID=3418370 RepID=UPI003CE85CD1
MADSTLTVSSGQTLTGHIINTNEVVNVAKGGAVVNTVLDPTNAYNQDDSLDPAELDVHGSALNTQMNDGYVEVYSGGVLSGVTVGNNAQLTVDVGGSATNVQVASAGAVTVGDDQGGTFNTSAYLSGATVSSGGNIYAEAGGIVTSANVLAGGYIEAAETGGVFSGSTIQSGAMEYVDSGASVSHETIQSGGFFMAESGANVSDVTGVLPGYAVTTDDDVVLQTHVTADGKPFSGVDISTLPAEQDATLMMYVTSGAEVDALKLAAPNHEGNKTDVILNGTLSGVTVATADASAYTGPVSTIFAYDNAVLEGTISGGKPATVSGTIPALNISMESGTTLQNATVGGGVWIYGNEQVASSLWVKSGAAFTGNVTVTSGALVTVEGGSASGQTFEAGSQEQLLAAGGSLSGQTFQDGSQLSAQNSDIYHYSGTTSSIQAAPATIASNTFASKTSAIIYGEDTQFSNNAVNGGTVLVFGSNQTLTSNTYTSGASIVLEGTVAQTADILGSGVSEVVQNAKDTLQNMTLQNGATLQLDLGSANHVTMETAVSVYVGADASLSNTTIVSGATLQFNQNSNLQNDILQDGAILIPQFYGDMGVSGNTFTFTNSETGQVETLQIEGGSGNYKLGVLDDQGIYEIEDGTPCYCRGTLIETDRGEVPVEHLQIGDQVRTLEHGFRPIRWIGRRAYSGQFAAGNPDVLPVIFRRGSLAEGLPRQDLSVSPLHAMYLDNVLVPAVALVNGTSIMQAEAMDEVAYFHIELESHDIIFANGTWSETFVDDESRGMFHNAVEYATLYPSAPKKPAQYCAPRVEEGPRLEAIRKRLNARAGVRPRAQGPLEGYIDTITRTRLTGWARNPENGAPVRLRILDCGVVLGEVVANQPRADMQDAVGFVFEVPGGLSVHERHVLEVQRVADHTALGNSPWMLDLAPAKPVQAVLARTPTTPLLGYVDCATREHVAGWAHSPTMPDEPVALQILDNGQLVASIVANGLRPDVRRAGGCATERCGFDVLLPTGLSPFTRHVLEIRRESDGALLGAPHVLEAVDAFDPTMQQAIAQAVAAATGEAEQAQVLSFLLGQVEKLTQAHARAQSGQDMRNLAAARARRGQDVAPLAVRKRALVVDTLRPDTGRDAGSHAVLSHMRALVALGYDVSLVAADQMDGAATLEVLPEVTVCTLPFYSSVEDVLRRQAGSFDVVYLHRMDTATRYAALTRRHQPKARVVYALADLHWLRLGRQAQAQGRPELMARARAVKQAEYSAMLLADVVMTHSTVEADLLRRELPQVRVQVTPWDVPVRMRVPGFARRDGVVFVGNYAHAPNADAARWLVQDIMPRVWATNPEIRCLLAGASMPAQLRALARDGVEILGHVQDLQALFDSVRLSVAPLRFGAGVKGKVLDSLAAGVPCVLSPAAAEGLELPQDLAAFVGQDADALAAAIVRLHQQASAHSKASRAGRAFMRAGFTAQQVQQALAAAIGVCAPQQMARQAG